MSRAATILVVAALWLLPRPAAAQSWSVSGYALGVVTQAGSGDLGPGGTSLLGRGRLMLGWRDGPFRLEAAYEHILERTPPGGGFAVTTPGGTSAGSGDWLGVNWTLRRTSRTLWRHGFDRLAVDFERGRWEVVAGRQAISWATTLYLTPADPFSPFSPSDPFREYRGGVDALRIRFSPGPFSEVETVVRPARTPAGTTLTALARGQTLLGNWAVGAWGGMLDDEAAGAAFATGAIGATAVRADVEVRRGVAGGAVARGALGLDRRFSLAGRDLYVVAEAQVDGLGTTETSQLLAVASSKPFVRGEMQVLGRYEALVDGSWQVHPLLAVDVLAMANLLDGSTLWAPGLSWSATASATVRAGMFVGAGAGTSTPVRLGSEYGSVPGLGYAAISWFF